MYTKGEWCVDGGLVYRKNGEAVCVVYEHENGVAEANARLIAKSPKMAELLVKLLNVGFSTDDENYEELSPILEEATDIIQSLIAQN